MCFRRLRTLRSENIMSALVEFPPELYDANAFQNFNPVPDFRLENALAMMWFAQLAYETGQPDTILHARDLWHFHQITPMASHILFKPSEKSVRAFSLDTRGVVGVNDDLLIIGFGGTDALVGKIFGLILISYPSVDRTYTGDFKRRLTVSSPPSTRR